MHFCTLRMILCMLAMTISCYYLEYRIWPDKLTKSKHFKFTISLSLSLITFVTVCWGIIHVWWSQAVVVLSLIFDCNISLREGIVSFRHLIKECAQNKVLVWMFNSHQYGRANIKTIRQQWSVIFVSFVHQIYESRIHTDLPLRNYCMWLRTIV